MLVKLLKDVLQNGAVKVSVSRRRGAMAFFKGTVLDLSEASAKKYIDAGDAEAYVEPKQEPQS